MITEHSPEWAVELRQGPLGPVRCPSCGKKWAESLEGRVTITCRCGRRFTAESGCN